MSTGTLQSFQVTCFIKRRARHHALNINNANKLRQAYMIIDEDVVSVPIFSHRSQPMNPAARALKKTRKAVVNVKLEDFYQMSCQTTDRNRVNHKKAHETT